MFNKQAKNTDEAEVIALKALGFIASDGERLERFMTMTGLSPQMIRSEAGNPVFLAGVLDHVASDQTLLYLFAETEGLAPERIDRARRSLPGTIDDF